MTIAWIIIVTFHLISIGFLALAVKRLHSYSKRHKLEENRHTLLFGFMQVQHAMLLYIVFILVYATGSVFFINFLASQ